MSEKIDYATQETDTTTVDLDFSMEENEVSLVDVAHADIKAIEDKLAEHDVKEPADIGDALAYDADESIVEADKDGMRDENEKKIIKEKVATAEIFAAENNLLGSDNDPVSTMIENNNEPDVVDGVAEIAKINKPLAEEIAKDVDDIENKEQKRAKFGDLFPSEDVIKDTMYNENDVLGADERWFGEPFSSNPSIQVKFNGKTQFYETPDGRKYVKAHSRIARDTGVIEQMHKVEAVHESVLDYFKTIGINDLDDERLSIDVYDAPMWSGAIAGGDWGAAGASYGTNYEGKTLGQDRAIVAHELAHRVFDKRVRSQEAKDRYWTINEAISDIVGFGMTKDSRHGVEAPINTDGTPTRDISKTNPSIDKFGEPHAASQYISNAAYKMSDFLGIDETVRLFVDSERYLPDEPVGFDEATFTAVLASAKQSNYDKEKATKITECFLKSGLISPEDKAAAYEYIEDTFGEKITENPAPQTPVANF
jgi:hypothetical protein